MTRPRRGYATTPIKNTLRGLLKIHGIVIRTCGTLSFEESIRSRIKPLDSVFAEAIHSLLEQFSVLTASVKKLTRHAENLAAKDEDTKLLMTVPGIGPLTALAYKTAIGDPKRFASSQDVGAYLGLTHIRAFREQRRIQIGHSSLSRSK